MFAELWEWYMVTCQARDMGSSLLCSKHEALHLSILLHLRHKLNLGSSLVMYLTIQKIYFFAFCLIYLTFSPEFEFMIHFSKFSFLGILSNDRLGRIKEVIALKQLVNDKPLSRKSFLSVLCLNYDYRNVVTGTTSTAITSLQ